MWYFSLKITSVCDVIASAGAQMLTTILKVSMADWRHKTWKSMHGTTIPPRLL